MGTAVYNDLTEGSIWRQLVRYSLPLVASSVLQATYSIVDMAVAGHFIGAVGQSAVSNASTIMTMVTNVIIGITTGGNILIGQLFGAKQKQKCADAVSSLFVVCMLMGIVLMVAFYFGSRAMLSALGAPALEEATEYLKICSIGIFFILGYNAMSATLRAAGNSRYPLICIAVTALINVVLDIVLVGPYNMGVAGAAIATVIAQGSSFVVSLIFVLKDYDIYGLSLKKLYARADSVKMIFKLGIPCAVQMSVAGISWLSVQYIINSYGVIISAANGISIKIKDFCQLFIVAVANGSTGMIAQNVGAGKYDRAKTVMYSAMKITVGMSAAMIILVELFAPTLARAFTSDAETIAAAALNLRIEIIGQIFYAIFLVYHSLALGAGNTWYVFFSSFANCILARIVLSFSLNYFFGLTGLYVACMISPFVSVPIGIWYEKSNRWRRSIDMVSASAAEEIASR